MPYYPDIALALFAVALLCLALASQKVPALARVAHHCRDYGLLVAFVFFFQQGVARACVIPTGSMLPTIQLQDRIVVNILDVKLHGVHHDDVVVLRSPESNIYLCKRVVALGGDTVAVHDGFLWLNGKAQHESYVTEAMAGTYGPYKVPAGHVFVMGDNRNDSHDSRSFGSVPASDILGRASAVIWPLGRVGSSLQ